MSDFSVQMCSTMAPQPHYSEPIYPLIYFIFSFMYLALLSWKGKWSRYTLALSSFLELEDIPHLAHSNSLKASSHINYFLKKLKINSQSISRAQSHLGPGRTSSDAYKCRFNFLRWIIFHWSLGQENRKASLWKPSKRHCRNMQRHRSSDSNKQNRCQGLRKKPHQKKLSCEASRALSQAETASVW